MSNLIEREETAVAQVSPMQLMQVAIQSNADVEKMEKLMALHERWEASNAKKAFFSAMAKFQAKCPTIYKLKAGHNYSYAPLSDIQESIKGLMLECGLSLRFEQSDENGIIKITCIVSHSDGHSERTSMTGQPDTSGSKNGIQARGSAVTYLMRYTLIGALGITTADADTDGRVSWMNQANDGEATVEQCERITSLLKTTGRDLPKFLNWVSGKYKRTIDTLSDLKASEADAAIRGLENSKNA